MPQIWGLHHVSVPATDVLRSSDWFEQVFGFSCILIEEDEDRVALVILEHPSGILLHIREAADLVTACRRPGATAIFGFSVADQSALDWWERKLTELGVEHSARRQAHLGLALDVTGPDGLGIQLHTYEELSGDDT